MESKTESEFCLQWGSQKLEPKIGIPKEGSVWARFSLKQLWEECCAEADEIGPEFVKELENQLLLF